MNLERKEIEALSSVGDLTQHVHTNTELQQALDIIASAAISGLKIKGCSVKMLNERHTRLEIVSIKGMSDVFVENCGVYGMFRSCVNQEALQGEKVYITETDTEKDYEIPGEVSKEGIHSIASIPIKVENRVLGVISVYDDKKHEFDTIDQAYLDMLATQCGLVMNAYRQAQRNETLLKVAKIVNSSLDIDYVLKEIVEQAAHAMKCKAASVRIYDRAADRLVFKTAYGLSDEYMSVIPTSVWESPIDRQVMETKETIYIEDVHTDPRVIMPEQTKAENISSMLCAPMHIKERSIGILKVYTAKPAPFSQDEIKFLGSLAELSAVAIDNASLFDKIDAMYRMTLEMASTINVQKLLDILTRKATHFVQAMGARVMIWDEDHEEFSTRMSYGLPEKFNCVKITKNTWSARETLLGHSIIINNIAEDQRLDIRDAALEAGIHSMMSIPMKIMDKVTGILQVYCRAPREFSTDEVEFLTTLANHSAIAVDNAIIHEKLRADYEKLIDDIYVWHDWTTYVLRE